MKTPGKTLFLNKVVGWSSASKFSKAVTFTYKMTSTANLSRDIEASFCETYTNATTTTSLISWNIMILVVCITIPMVDSFQSTFFQRKLHDLDVFWKIIDFKILQKH